MGYPDNLTKLFKQVEVKGMQGVRWRINKNENKLKYYGMHKKMKDKN